jgi:hypothetical protein
MRQVWSVLVILLVPIPSRQMGVTKWWGLPYIKERWHKTHHVFRLNQHTDSSLKEYTSNHCESTFVWQIRGRRHVHYFKSGILSYLGGNGSGEAWRLHIFPVLRRPSKIVIPDILCSSPEKPDTNSRQKGIPTSVTKKNLDANNGKSTQDTQWTHVAPRRHK